MSAGCSKRKLSPPSQSKSPQAMAPPNSTPLFIILYLSRDLCVVVILVTFFVSALLFSATEFIFR